MIDYTKMDEVIKKLDTGADSVLELAQTQKELERALSTINDAVEIVNSVKSETEKLNIKISAIEQQQSNINKRLEDIKLNQSNHGRFMKIGVSVGVGAAILSCILSIIALLI